MVYVREVAELWHRVIPTSNLDRYCYIPVYRYYDPSSLVWIFFSFSSSRNIIGGNGEVMNHCNDCIIRGMDFCYIFENIFSS